MNERSRVGVLLVNLGTPDTADARGVRVYLREFLSDPRVIERQGLLWQTILNGIVLQVRPRRKARDYEKIWNVTRNESPLKTITHAQAEKLGAALGSGVTVGWGMRYGNPSLDAALRGLIDQGCDRILIAPLYPQYSASTTATVHDKLADAMRGLRAQPALRYLPPYYDDAAYIDALATSIETHVAASTFTPDTIVASFHGMPKSYIAKGDPYEAQCIATIEALRARMGRDANSLRLTFQSRFGYEQWLQPYTDKTLEAMAKDGVKRVAVVTPGFSADCLETLEEIAGENAEIFRHAGGEHFAYVPCLNDSEGGMRLLTHLIRRELQGWI